MLLDAQAPSSRQLLHAVLARELTDRPGDGPAPLVPDPLNAHAIASLSGAVDALSMCCR